MARLPGYDARLEWVLPMKVTGAVDFTLVAVWAMSHRSHQPIPVDWAREQPLAAADVYDFETISGPIVVTGDFNNAPEWDTRMKPQFASMLERYASHDLYSAYHATSGERFGQETQPTLW